MLVPGMREADLLKELKADYLEAFNISEKKDHKVTRLIQKASIFPFFVHAFVTTPRKNKWLIVWEAKSKKNIGDNAIITFVCMHDTPHGRYAYMPTFVDGNLILIAYAPHFFSRYAERMGIKLTGLDLFLRYFKMNASYGFRNQEETLVSGGIIEHVYGSCQEGVALGVKSAVADIILFKTFVSYDMLKNQQVEDFAQTEKIRQEIHGKTFAAK